MRQFRVRALRWSLVGLLAVVVSGASDARATTLRWKFQAGETLHYVMDQKTVTEVKAGGQNIKTTLTQTIDMTWAIRGVGSDGNADLTQSIDRVRTKIDSPFGAFEFDSKNKDAKPAEGVIAASLAPLLKALVGAQFTLKMNPQGELSDIKVPESVTKALREAGPAGGGGNAGMFSEDGLKNMIRESSLALPAEDLDKGKSWNRQTKIPMPPVGTMVLDKTYTFRGPDAEAGPNTERIELATKVELQTAPDVKDATIKITAQEGKGNFFFNTANGRVTRSTVSEKVETVITVQAMDITQINDTTTTMKLLPES